MDFRLRAALCFALSTAIPACADDTPITTDTGDTSSGTGPGVSTTVTTSTTNGMTTFVDGTSESGSDTTIGVDDTTTTTTLPPPTTTGDTETETGTETTGGLFDCTVANLGQVTGNNVANGSTVGQGDDYSPPCAKPGSPDVMYQWTAPAGGDYQFTLYAEFEGPIVALLSPNCDGFTIGCGPSTVATLNAGQTIVIVVDGAWSEGGYYELNINQLTGGGGDCCEWQPGPGCNDPACEAAVCAIDSWCCNQQWDEWCAFDLAQQYCEQCFPLGGCCYNNGTPSCEDQACADQVCAVDPSCCDTAWTASCAEMALQNCAVCGPGVGNCCAGNNSPGCENALCQAIVCGTFDPWCCDGSWDEWCAQEALDVCSICQPLGPCCVPNFSPGCNDPFVQDCVCATMPECCSPFGTWTQACADAVLTNGCGACPPLQFNCVDADLGSALGQVATGTNIGESNNLALPCTAPGGNDVAFTWTSPADGYYQFDTFGTNYDVAIGLIYPDCVGEVINCDGMFMQTNQQITRFLPAGVTVVVAIDGFGATLGNYVLNINYPPGTGFCCIANNSPGCSNASCQTQVCQADPSCCVNWTQQCADLANAQCLVCQGGAGSCCAPNNSPGCSDLGCAATVCAMEPWCCDEVWDEWCVELAMMSCAGC